jgi:hypothetical protein
MRPEEQADSTDPLGHDEPYSHPATEEEDRRPSDDWDWASTDPDVRTRYGGRVVAVHRRKVWGVGDNCFEAAVDARKQPGCPHVLALTFVDLFPLDLSF